MDLTYIQETDRERREQTISAIAIIVAELLSSSHVRNGGEACPRRSASISSVLGPATRLRRRSLKT